MSWVRSFEGLVDFLSLVIVHAPDEFPQEDFLCDDEQLTLETAFKELNHGMVFVKQRIREEAVLMQLQNTLEDSLAAYRQGEDIKGARLLQQCEDIIFRNGVKSVHFES